MAIKTIAPYGRWESAISVEAATAGTRTLTSPRTCPRTGRSFFLASKPDASSTIVEVAPADGGPPRAVLPDAWGVGTTVYEYGGQAYAILPPPADEAEHRQLRIAFSSPRDHACRLLAVDACTVTTLVPGTAALRYGDFHAHPTGRVPWILAVQEDHTNPRPADVRNYIVGIHTDTGEVVRLVEGADFYSYPRFGPDPTGQDDGDGPAYRFSWRQWDHPGLPFDGVTLHWAVWRPGRREGPVRDAVLVAGDAGQCVAETAWTPGGSLVFGMEHKDANFRQLFRVQPDAPTPQPIVLKGLEEAEFGDASWLLGCQTFVFLSPTTLVAVATSLGKDQLVYADLQTGAWAPLDVGLVEMIYDPLTALSPTAFLVIGSGYTTPYALYRVDLDLDALRAALARHDKGASTSYATSTRLFSSTEQDFPPKTFFTPELIQVADPGTQRPIYGWFWPPHNPSFAAPSGTQPPLIISPHGGPTGHSAPGLHILSHFWTSRGYAYFAINYAGSSGHGRAYRDSLWSRWGELDVRDVQVAVASLAGSRVDSNRVGIEGSSAGGYNVLQSLVQFPDLFASGISRCGVADTATLARATHKLESRYVDRLVLPLEPVPPATQARIHRERSPLFHADRIRAPLLLIHGDHDTVVPFAQSEAIRDQIRARGGDVDLVRLPGEGHMMAKTESKIRYLQAEAAWWEKTLLQA